VIILNSTDHVSFSSFLIQKICKVFGHDQMCVEGYVCLSMSLSDVMKIGRLVAQSVGM